MQTMLHSEKYMFLRMKVVKITKGIGNNADLVSQEVKLIFCKKPVKLKNRVCFSLRPTFIFVIQNYPLMKESFNVDLTLTTDKILIK
jgi:hypothetical protein